MEKNSQTRGQNQIIEQLNIKKYAAKYLKMFRKGIIPISIMFPTI